MTKGKEYLTTREIAQKLDVHLRTVGNWIRKGELPAVRVGGQYRISIHDFEAFLEERRTARKD